MCPTVKLLLISLLLAGVAVISATKERTKRNAQVPQEPQPQETSVPNLSTSPSPLGRFLQGVSGRIRHRLENRNLTSIDARPLWGPVSRINQQQTGPLVLDGLLRRINENWIRRFSGSNTTVPSRNLLLLRELFQLRNVSSTDQRARIDGLIDRFFSDLRQRLSGSNMTIPSQNLQELRNLIRQRIEQHRNRTQQGLQELLRRIESLLRQRIGTTVPGRVPPSLPQTSGGGSVPSTGSGSGSGSGSGESGDRSGSASSGSGESGTSS
ncbi:uncharacterized protein [Halyomorpha halys]|uniref:uncharacterized protein n=1 Tax=Halyomorpha halys TaxID=286706 RepID=UPI0006D5146A|nr:uncharacterized protein LOC106689071 [Halyomorpha halys]